MGRMREIIKNHVSGTDLKGVVEKLTKSDIGNDIRKSCQLTFPLKICLIEKVKVLRKPKKDVAKLMQMHDLVHGFDDLTAIAEEQGSDAEDGSGGDEEDDMSEDED